MLRRTDVILGDVHAFCRTWQKHRHTLVGPNSRFAYVDRDGNGVYDIKTRHKYNIVLTGAAFVHRSYLHAYTFDMPQAIYNHVANKMNCEDIAMNFVVAHLTRRPPVRTARFPSDA